MKKTALLAAGALLGSVGLAGTANAGHDVNDSGQVAEYQYDLGTVQDQTGDDAVPGTDASGDVTVKALPNGRVEVQVSASGLTPGQPHAMHLHGILGSEQDNACPELSADVNDDGVVDTLEGAPAYGGVVTSLTTSGDASDASALALGRFPVADEDGNLEYERAIQVQGNDVIADAVYDEAGTLQVVVHSADLDGDGDYGDPANNDFAEIRSSLSDDLSVEFTVPVLCGGVAN